MADLVITPANVIAGPSAVVSKLAMASEPIRAGQVIYLARATKTWMLASRTSEIAEARKAGWIALNTAAPGQPLVGQIGGEITMGAVLTVVSCPRFPWTSLCRKGDRDGPAEGPPNERAGWSCCC